MPLTLTEKLCYGVGEIPITVTMVLFGLFVLFFYGTVMQLPGTLVGIGMAIGLLWDAFVDPYIGHRSDCIKTRFGRRHGFMLAGALTMGLCFWLLLSPPPGLSTVPLFLWLLGTTLAFRFTSAVYRIPYLSLGAELTSDYYERTRIVGIRSVFGLLGTLAAATLSFALFFPTVDPAIDPKLEYAGYSLLGACTGVVITLAGLVAIAGTWRRRRPHWASISRQSVSFITGFRSALANPSFRRLWLTFTLFFLGIVLNAVVAIHYFTWYVQFRDSTVLSHIQLAFYLGALGGVSAWVLAARYVAKHHLCLFSIAGTATLLFMATWLFGEGRLFGAGNPVPFMTGNALAGLLASGLWVLPGAMVADISDEDQLRQGKRREGLFFGLLNFGEKMASGAALLAGGLLVDRFVGLVPGEPQAAAVVERIGMIYGILPGLILIGAGMALIGYRLDHRAVQTIQDRLARRQGASEF